LKRKRRFTWFTKFCPLNADDMCSHAQPVARGTHAPPLFLYFQCVPVAPFDYPDFSKSNDLMCFEITCDNCKCNCCLCKLVKEMCVCLHFFYIVFECLKPKRQKKIKCFNCIWLSLSKINYICIF
jgi:hypothetical protein